LEDGQISDEFGSSTDNEKIVDGKWYIPATKKNTNLVNYYYISYTPVDNFVDAKRPKYFLICKEQKSVLASK